VPTPPCPDLLPRGVYRAPCFGPNGETIVFAVDHRHRRIDDGVVYLPPGEDVVAARNALWRMLDAVDPEHSRRRLVREQATALAS
jgi:hypothetical protein